MVGIFSAASIPLWAAGISAAGGLAGGLLGPKGGPGGGLQTQQTNAQLPGWVNEAAMQNYGAMTRASYDMPGPYTGQRVADLTPETRNLINQLYGNVGSTGPAYENASATTNALMGFNAPTITPQTLAGTNLQPYMDPYISQVINPSMQLLNQQRQQGLNQIGDQANQAKAFGGSRQGIAEGMTNAQSSLLAGQLGGQLYGNAFQNALAGATGDITRNLTAQQQNAANAIQSAGLRGSMAGQLGNLATAGQNAWLTGVQQAMGGQGVLTQQQQQQLQAAMDLYNEQRMDPIQRIQLRTQQLSQSPYGQTTTSTVPNYASTSPLLSGLGTASTLAGLLGKFGAFGSTPQLGGIGGAGMQNALAMGGGLMPSYGTGVTWS